MTVHLSPGEQDMAQDLALFHRHQGQDQRRTGAEFRHQILLVSVSLLRQGEGVSNHLIDRIIVGCSLFPDFHNGTPEIDLQF